MFATTRGRSLVFRAQVSRATDRSESRCIWHGISLPVKINLPHRPRIPLGRAPPRSAYTGMRYAQPLAHCRSRRPVHRRAGTTPGATAADHDKAASKSRSPPQARGRSKRIRPSSLSPSSGRTDEPTSQAPSRSHTFRLKGIKLQLPERWRSATYQPGHGPTCSKNARAQMTVVPSTTSPRDGRLVPKLLRVPTSIIPGAD